MFNLISNAIKFSPDAGTIELKTQVSPSNVKISIKYIFRIKKNSQKSTLKRLSRGQGLQREPKHAIIHKPLFPRTLH